MTRHPWSIWSFDDLVVGDEWESPRRTVTETDVVLFAGLSGDFNPLHVDHSSAQEQPVRPARGSWTARSGHRHRPDEPGSARRYPRVPGHPRMEISSPDRLRGYDPRSFDGRVVAASRQRPARRRDLAPTNPEPRWTPRPGRPHANARASTIRDGHRPNDRNPERRSCPLTSVHRNAHRLATDYSIIVVLVISMTIQAEIRRGHRSGTPVVPRAWPRALRQRRCSDIATSVSPDDVPGD